MSVVHHEELGNWRFALQFISDFGNLLYLQPWKNGYVNENTNKGNKLLCTRIFYQSLF